LPNNALNCRSLRSLDSQKLRFCLPVSLIVRHSMNTKDWIKFFDLCNQVLGEGDYTLYRSENWCSWITFDRIIRDAQYWSGGIPKTGEYGEHGVGDGGNWGQPFPYSSIAHLIIPRHFEFCDMYQGEFVHKQTEQDIDHLSILLQEHSIEHVISEWALELRLISGRV